MEKQIYSEFLTIEFQIICGTQSILLNCLCVNLKMPEIPLHVLVTGKLVEKTIGKEMTAVVSIGHAEGEGFSPTTEP